MIGRRPALWLLALCTVLRIVSLVRPCLSDDEATYAVVGREMLSGHALYRDVVDHKPPAIYLVNELTQAVGGPIGGMVLLHVLLIVVVWATGLLLGAIASRFVPGDSRPPISAPLLWIVFTTTLVDTDSLAANCELFMMLPLVASVYLVLSERWFYAGLLVGVAMLFKYQAGIQLPVYAVMLISRHRKELGRLVDSTVGLTLGVAIPIGLAIGWLYLHGALDAAWFWFRFNFAYINTGSSSAMLPQIAVRVGFVLVAAAPLYTLFVIALFDEDPHPHLRVLIAWLVASAIAIIVGGRFFGHYFHQLTAPLAVIAAPAAVSLVENRRWLFVAVLAIPATIFLGVGIAHDRVMEAAGEPDPDYASVAAWLDQHGTASDGICIWGNSPVLYFEANRPLGCRFVFANYITGASPATPSQTDPNVDSSNNAVPEAWDMLESDLDKRQPTFVIDASPGNVGYYGKYPPEKFPRLAKILACRYASEADVAGMRIYRRLSTPRCDG